MVQFKRPLKGANDQEYYDYSAKLMDSVQKNIAAGNSTGNEQAIEELLQVNDLHLWKLTHELDTASYRCATLEDAHSIIVLAFLEIVSTPGTLFDRTLWCKVLVKARNDLHDQYSDNCESYSNKKKRHALGDTDPTFSVSLFPEKVSAENCEAKSVIIGDDALKNVIKNELNERLKIGLEALSDDDVLMLVDRLMNGFTLEQVAEKYGLSISGVSKRINKNRRIVESAIRNYDSDSLELIY